MKLSKILSTPPLEINKLNTKVKFPLRDKMEYKIICSVIEVPIHILACIIIKNKIGKTEENFVQYKYR